MAMMLVLVLVLVLMVMVMVVMMLMRGLVVVVAVRGPGPLALPASRLLLVDVRAQPHPVLFIPRAQRLASEHEVVVLDDGGHHPRVAGRVHLVRGGVQHGQVGHEHARLRRAVWSRAF